MTPISVIRAGPPVVARVKGLITHRGRLHQGNFIPALRVILANDRRDRPDRLEPQRALASRAPRVLRRLAGRSIESLPRAQLLDRILDLLRGLLDLGERRRAAERDAERGR